RVTLAASPAAAGPPSGCARSELRRIRKRSEELRPVAHRAAERGRGALAEAADRSLLHCHEPLLELPAGHGRAVVLELVQDVLEAARADAAGRTLLARLLGEEAHRLADEPQHRVRRGKDLHAR